MDQRRAATDVGGSNDTSNMRSKAKWYRTEYGVVLDDQGSTDVYDSVAEARAAATDETPLVRIVTTPLDAPSVQPPTREQIAVVYQSAVSSQLSPGEFLDALDVLGVPISDDALFPQPTPSAEPCTCPPPATHLGEGPDQDCPKHGDRFHVTEPPSIADMAPGTTFTAQQWGGVLRFPLKAISAERFDVQDDDGGWLDIEDIDPSTIRDVTPPPATPEDGDRG